MDRFALRYRARKFQEAEKAVPDAIRRCAVSGPIGARIGNIAHDGQVVATRRVLLADEVGLGEITLKPG